MLLSLAYYRDFPNLYGLFIYVYLNSSGAMHSRVSYLSEACRACYTSCGNVAGNGTYLILQMFI